MSLKGSISIGIAAGQIEEAENFSIMRLRDPDNNLVVFASAKNLKQSDSDPVYRDGTEA